MAIVGVLTYDTIPDFIQWISKNFAGILANDNPNDYTTGDDEQQDVIKQALLSAEGEVNGYLKQRGYAVPIDSQYVGSINVLKMYVRNIAVYELYGRRGIKQEQYYKYKNTMMNLEKFGSGEKTLPDDPPFANKNKLALGNNLESVFAESSERTRHSL